MEFVKAFFAELWNLTSAMAPYLLFGFLIAGILHIFVSPDRINMHLSGNDLKSVLKASLFGVPLPLCSCGVIPVASQIRNDGASKGATVSFLTSTPTTGIDSILATYSLLGGIIAVIRPISAFVMGITSGLLINMFNRENAKEKSPKTNRCAVCGKPMPHSHTLKEKIKAILNYGFGEMVEDTGRWIVIGIVVGAFISTVIPDGWIKTHLSNPLVSYTSMLLVSVPMYICATGSIPIAASLIAKGISPGAGLILLIAGPATNTATLSFVLGKLGRKTFIVYITSIVISAVIFALMVDYLLGIKPDVVATATHAQSISLINTVSAVILILLIISAFLRTGKHNEHSHSHGEHSNEYALKVEVPEMTCKHCVMTVKKAVETLDGVKEVSIDLKSKGVLVSGKVKVESVVKAIKETGYTPQIPQS